MPVDFLIENSDLRLDIMYVTENSILQDVIPDHDVLIVALGESEKNLPALQEIARRFGLEYLVIDCAETRDGQLLIFEVDSGAWVHATDCPVLFPYKSVVMQKAFDAFRRLLIKKANTFRIEQQITTDSIKQ
ncbi:hypothetical protein ACO0LB_02190 [Undibacterium sp. SXout7W]|uniref:hypothetical protein n=1 Tax=Undibacterium sp. SXout7W TaxID=3413049 RepID=UPI003BF29F6A